MMKFVNSLYSMKLREKGEFDQVLTLSSFWQLSPHLLDPLQHHVAVAVKSLHPTQQLLVVPDTFHAKQLLSRGQYLQLIKTWVLFLTESVRTLSGPVENSSCSFASRSSGVMSALLAILINDTISLKPGACDFPLCSLI